MPRYEFFLGIDPGLEGACVLQRSTGEFVEFYKFKTLPVKDTKRRLHIYDLYLYLHQLSNAYPGKIMVCIEKINGSPGQGATSIFSMGHTAGVIESLVCISSLAYEFISPQKWKNKLMSDMPKEKEASVVKALQIFPRARDWCIGPRGGKDHNIADAMFLAEYCRQFYT